MAPHLIPTPHLRDVSPSQSAAHRESEYHYLVVNLISPCRLRASYLTSACETMTFHYFGILAVYDWYRLLVLYCNAGTGVAVWGLQQRPEYDAYRCACRSCTTMSSSRVRLTKSLHGSVKELSRIVFNDLSLDRAGFKPCYTALYYLGFVGLSIRPSGV